MLVIGMRKNVIKDLMKSQGRTIYALAKATQMPWHNVKKIVNAPSIPDKTEYRTLLLLADALGVGIDDLEVKEE